ncbi:DUF3592 domain-containing protein [Kitasatospora sp. NPDC059577]|uniref:DUF3592 domain-containing protein n=1 Tax=unclassified Kitasatospora TaxID=2633591 RepID=UPI00367B3900
MDWHGFVALWCAVLGAVALVGYGRSLTGMTKAQRAVRVRGRIERVREPRHGGSHRDGISVVVSYRDPSTGQDVTVTNDGDRGERITAAWTDREIEVSYPPRRPHAFRFSTDLRPVGRGLGRPNTALFFGYLGLVVVAAIDWGWPWALVGVCGPWAVTIACHLPGNVRDVHRRRETTDSMVAVPGRVIAVLKDVSSDAEGGTTTTITPVVAFTTREGTAVTAHCTAGLPNPAGSHRRELTVHYSPADPADFTPDLEARRRSQRTDVTVNVLGLVVIAAAAVVGAVLL